ncbi:MAG: hypothetical protein P8R54_29560 [Myxococcota bacterium]|nr:hypothetical protein [Myxococcota bacterium]
MQSGLSHRKDRRANALQELNADLQKQNERELEHLEEGQELSADQTATLQPQVGNQAILNLLNRLSDASHSISNVELEEEQEEEAQEQEQEEDLESELELRHLSSGGGGGGGGASGNPWEVGHLFGGEDDDPVDAPRRPQHRRAATRGDPSALKDPFEEEYPEGLSSDDLAGIDAALGPVAPRADRPRWGDARYQAVEGALLDPARLGRPALTPESLVGYGGPQDPLGRAAEIGRFLSRLDPEAAVAALLVGPAPVLMTGASGYAGAAARLASLAVCAEAAEGGETDTDAAVALALVRDAWPTAVEAAREAARRGRLHAPLIVAMVLGEPVSLPAARARLVPPSRLGGQALERVLPKSFIPVIPVLKIDLPQAQPILNDALAAADAVLARMTGGHDPQDAPALPILTPEALRPILSAANALISALGKAQVEAAAAAIAVRKIRPDAPIRSPLAHTDRALRELARGVIKAGRSLERNQGQPLMQSRKPAERAIIALRDSAAALDALRSWVFATLAGALHAETT